MHMSLIISLCDIFFLSLRGGGGGRRRRGWSEGRERVVGEWARKDSDLDVW